MLKFFRGVLLSVAMLFCAIGFAACGEADVELRSVSIDTMPATLSYTVGQNLELTGGKLKLTFSDDSTKVVPMTLGSPDITIFKKAAQAQSVVLSYGGMSVRFNVEVKKADMHIVVDAVSVDTDGKAVVNKAYTGSPIEFDALVEASIPQEDGILVNYTYKKADAQNADYTSSAPVNAGKYLVKINVTNSQDYNDAEYLCYMVIQKANLDDVVIDGESLVYDVKRVNSDSVYGKTLDLSSYWKYSNGYLGVAPLDADMVSQLIYSYRLSANNEYNVVPAHADGSHPVTLPVGEYDIRISLSGNSNISDYEYDFRLVVKKAQLLRGVDYDLYITDGVNDTLINEPNTLVALTPDTTYSLKIVSKVGDDISLREGTIYISGNSTSKITILNNPHAGVYTAVYAISGDVNYQNMVDQQITFVFE